MRRNRIRNAPGSHGKRKTLEDSRNAARPGTGDYQVTLPQEMISEIVFVQTGAWHGFVGYAPIVIKVSGPQGRDVAIVCVSFAAKARSKRAVSNDLAESNLFPLLW